MILYFPKRTSTKHDAESTQRRSEIEKQANRLEKLTTPGRRTTITNKPAAEQ